MESLAGHTFYLEWEVQLMLWIQAHIGVFGEDLAALVTHFGEGMMTVVLLGFLYWSYDKELGKYAGTNAVVASVFMPLVKNVALRRRPYFDHPQIQCLRQVSAGDPYDIRIQGYSFPSGHSINTVAFYGSVARYVHAADLETREQGGGLDEDGGRTFLHPGKRKTLPSEMDSTYIKEQGIPPADVRDSRGKALYTRPGRTACTVVGICLPLLVGISRFTLGVHYPTDVLAGWGSGLAIIFLVPWLQGKFADQKLFYLILLCLGGLGFFYCRTQDFYTDYGLMLGFFGGVCFEERFVGFEDAVHLWERLLRLAGGIGLYLVLNFLLKGVLSSFGDMGESVRLLLRTVRYAVLMFVLMGVYPIVFRRCGK